MEQKEFAEFIWADWRNRAELRAEQIAAAPEQQPCLVPMTSEVMYG
jgi:hypothetical protein